MRTKYKHFLTSTGQAIKITAAVSGADGWGAPISTRRVLRSLEGGGSWKKDWGVGWGVPSAYVLGSWWRAAHQGVLLPLLIPWQSPFCAA